ncbi:MAG: hypothetical protein ACOX6V_03160 [Patescibacteria group bacterium]|jgi:cytoskeletal protein CcmA (bactofilin family)
MRKLLSGLVIFLASTLLFSPVFAQQENQQPQDILLEPEQTHEGNYFAAAPSVTVSGVVNGDAYVAGGTIIIEGIINGDLLAAGGTIYINGTVTEDVRIAAGQVVVSGSVGDSVTAAAGTVEVTNSGQVGDGIVTAAGNVRTFGPVNQDITAAAGQITVGDFVGGDINTYTEQLTLTPSAVVNGNIEYWSKTEADIQPGAQVFGTTERNEPQKIARPPLTEEVGRALTQAGLVAKLISLLSYLVVGLILLALFPVFTRQTVNTIYEQALLSLGIGFLTVILFPILFVILLITVVGIPIAFILLALFLIFWYLSVIFVSLVIGAKVLGLLLDRHKLNGWTLLVGLIIYGLLTLIPVVGWIIMFLAGLIGLGGLLIEERHYYSALHSEEVI